VGEFRYASDLVAFIRSHSGSHFRIEVAAYPEFHPQARSPGDDLAAFAAKVRAGADRAITQYFYNADAYFRFRDEALAAGIDVPIIPGIMPITNYAQLARFSDNCGAEIPRWIRRRLAAMADDAAAIREFGLEVVTELCRRLVAGGAPGLHFYTLNQADASLAIVRALG
jgi:methylenetetrahydrofolate reductase (NADPH)